MLKIEIETPDAGKYTMNAEPKTFKSGKKGFYANGKMKINGVRHQVGLIFTQITSKPKEGNTPSSSSSKGDN